MPEQPFIAVFVKLEYWDAYRVAVALTARQLRKVLFFFAIMAALALALFVLAMVRPRPQADWYETMQDSRPLAWVFVIPLVLVFVLPLLSSRKVLTDERLKKGSNYRFSDAGIHVESSVATADLQWAAIREAIETRSAFLLLPSANIAHTLPKRCFADNVDIVAMRDLLHANVPKAKLRGE